MSSMRRFDAASISTTSNAEPAAISWQTGDCGSGEELGPSSQFRAIDRMRAIVVLPVPRGPEKM